MCGSWVVIFCVSRLSEDISCAWAALVVATGRDRETTGHYQRMFRLESPRCQLAQVRIFLWKEANFPQANFLSSRQIFDKFSLDIFPPPLGKFLTNLHTSYLHRSVLRGTGTAGRSRSQADFGQIFARCACAGKFFTNFRALRAQANFPSNFRKSLPEPSALTVSAPAVRRGARFAYFAHAVALEL